MTPITIPPAALEAAEEAFLEADRVPSNSFEDCIRAAALALLENWPGNVHYRGGWEPVVHNNRKPHIILPLNTETDND